MHRNGTPPTSPPDSAPACLLPSSVQRAPPLGLQRNKGHAGDVWTWTALDADSKLAVSWLIGGRDAGYAYVFMQDVASRLANRVQLTTDGHKPYLSAVEEAAMTE